MKSLKTIRRQARAMVAAANGPLGARPLQRVISDHLGFFADLRAEGASWQQIAALLEGEGLRSRVGEPVSTGVLRALCSRAMKTRAPYAPQTTPASMPPSTDGDAWSNPIPPVRSSSPASRSPTKGSLAEAIARAARLRGISPKEDLQ